MSTELVQRLRDEADLCRNDGAGDIAALLDEASARMAELLEEVAVDDTLLATQYRLMDHIPGCELHGNRCVPGAIEWVTTIRAKTLEEAAVICDNHAANRGDNHESTAIECCADEIRELAGKEQRT